MPLYVDDHVIVHLREHNGEVAIVATNNAATDQRIILDLRELNLPAEYVDALTAQKRQVSGGRLLLTVPAYYGIVLVAE